MSEEKMVHNQVLLGIIRIFVVEIFFLLQNGDQRHNKHDASQQHEGNFFSFALTQ